MPKTIKGEVISWREFFKRWGQGIKDITPFQQIKIQLVGQVIITTGIIWGMIFSYYLHQGWLMLILFGSLIVSCVGLLGSIQKYMAFSKINDIMKGVVE